MKIEKINDNKVKITLSIEELESRKISPADLQANKSKAQGFFFKLLKETKLENEFLEESSRLFIEASTLNNQFMVVITKIYDLPDTSNYTNSKYSSIFRVTSNIYEFSNLQNILDFAKLHSKKIYLGVNSLFLYNDKYYVVFSQGTIRKSEFIQTFLVISEYADCYYKKQCLTNLIYEYGKPILEKDALKKLSKV